MQLAADQTSMLPQVVVTTAATPVPTIKNLTRHVWVAVGTTAAIVSRVMCFMKGYSTAYCLRIVVSKLYLLCIVINSFDEVAKCQWGQNVASSVIAETKYWKLELKIL